MSTEIAVLLLLTAFGAALRFSTLGVQSFSFDEAFGAHRVLDGSLGHVLSALPRTESSPPLHYLLAWLWSNVFGSGEVALRSLSALAGTALVPVTWAAARALGLSVGALIAAALVAFNPFLIWYSQEARTYALFALLAGASFWAFCGALGQGTTRRLMVWAGVSALALTSHYFAVFVVVPEAVWLLVFTPRRRPALAAVGVVAAAGLALLPLALRQAGGRTEWISGEPLSTRARGVVSKFLVGEIDPTSDAVLLGGALVLLGVLVWIVLRCDARDLRAAKLAGAVGAAALLLPTGLDLVGFHYVLSRNLIASMPVLAVAAGATLGAASGALGRVTAGLLCAAWLAIGVAGALDPRLQRFDFRSAARAVEPELRPDVAVIASSPGSAPLELYLAGTRTPGPEGTLATEIVLVQPLRRRDARAPGRGETPEAPVGFAFADRRDRRTYTLIRYRAPQPVRVGPATADQVTALAGNGPTLLERPAPSGEPHAEGAKHRSGAHAPVHG